MLRIVHAALVASILLFGGLLAMVTQPPGDPVVGAEIPIRAEPPAMLTPVIAALAGASLLALLIVRRRMARDRDAAANQASPDGAARRTPARVYSGSIVSWALCESIALYGLVLGIIHRGVKPFLPFAGLSLLLMVLLAPRRSHIQ